MKIQYTDAEMQKIIFKKIGNIQKLFKSVKVDKKGNFIDTLYTKFLGDIKNIVYENGDHYEDDSQLSFSLYVYTNVDLMFFSHSILGYNYGISKYEIDSKSKSRFCNVDDAFYDIDSLEKLQDFFHKRELILPNNIEIIELNFTGTFKGNESFYKYQKI